MAKKQKCPPCPSVAKWMTTFSDMNQLLMTFFVLLVSMANFDKVKMVEAFGILQGSRSILNNPAPESKNDFMIIPPVGRDPVAEQVSSAQESLQSYVESQNLQQMISIIPTDKGFNIQILNSVLFRTGSSDLSPESQPVLRQIAAIANTLPYYLSIKGHADDQPTGQFAELNWDLSTNRALSVLKYLMGEGVPGQKMSAMGFGEYHPVLPNITPEARAQNRRVEISFISPEFYEANKDIFGNTDFFGRQ